MGRFATDATGDSAGDARETGAARRFGVSAVLGLCVWCSGAAVMVYELLGVRFLARYFGGSVDVWAFVIAVCLAGLSIGYFVGGLLADRFRSWRVLGAALLTGGFSALFMERLAAAAGERLLEVDTAIVWHPFIAALASMFLPILALGTVLPQAIRLQVRSVERVGRSAGWLAALSSLGSVAATLLTVIVLLPRLGVRETVYGTSAVLMVFGVALFFVRARRSVAVALAAVCVAVVSTGAHAQVVFDKYSAYHHILVEDQGNIRLLRFDNDVQSTMSLADPYAGGFEYTDFFHAPMALDPTVRDVLFIGLGGGTGPKTFLALYPQVKVTVSEIDPMVVEVAKNYFALPEDPRLKIITMDGRQHLQRTRRPFGAIVVDAYGSGPYGAYLPYHLATSEFFQLAWERLENGGCLVYNVMGLYGGINDDVVRNVLTTLESVFQTVYTFQAQSSWNTVFVAVKIDPSTLHPSGTRDGEGWPLGPWLQHPLSGSELERLTRALARQGGTVYPGLGRRVRQFSPAHTAPRTGMVLTDNFAPVDLTPGRR